MPPEPNINYRRLAAAAVTAWLLSIPLGAFMHHGVLGRVYAADAAAFRPDADIIRRLPIGYAAELLGFLVAAWIYARLYSRRPGIVEGLRFGLLIGVVLVSLVVIWNYVTQPISALVGIAEVMEYLVGSTVAGGIIGVIYRPGAASPPA